MGKSINDFGNFGRHLPRAASAKNLPACTRMCRWWWPNLFRNRKKCSIILETERTYGLRPRLWLLVHAIHPRKGRKGGPKTKGLRRKTACEQTQLWVTCESGVEQSDPVEGVWWKGALSRGFGGRFRSRRSCLCSNLILRAGLEKTKNRNNDTVNYSNVRRLFFLKMLL